MLLMVGEGRPSDQGNTVASKQRKTLRADLESSLKEAEVQLDLENLIGGQARWMDKEVKGLPPPRIAREILWELCEVNFRNDVLALDKHLDTSGMNLLDRQDLVGKCWIGTSSDVDCSTSTQAGIGASVVAMRLDYLRAMYQVVATWRPAKPEALLEEFPANIHSHNFWVSLDRVEKALAEYYTDSFYNVFRRAASIPYRL